MAGIGDDRTAGGLSAFAAAGARMPPTALVDPRSTEPGPPRPDLYRGSVEPPRQDSNAAIDLAARASRSGASPSGPTAGTISGGTITILAGAATNTADILATGDLSILAGS